MSRADAATATVVLPGSPAFARGVLALPGYEITGLRFADAPDLASGLQRLVAVLAERGLGPESVAGLELRSPEAVDAEQFAAFNERYCALLVDAGIIEGTANPVTRTNAVPAHSAPAEVALVAAQVVRASPSSAGGDFVISGAAELRPDGSVAAAGDESVAGLREKAECVVAAMSERMEALGAGSPRRVNIYYPGEIDAVLAAVLGGVRADEGAEVCHWRCWPPITGPVFEVDCRRLSAQEVMRG